MLVTSIFLVLHLFVLQCIAVILLILESEFGSCCTVDIVEGYRGMYSGGERLSLKFTQFYSFFKKERLLEYFDIELWFIWCLFCAVF